MRSCPNCTREIWKERVFSEYSSLFSVHTARKETTITSYFGFMFEENSVREITWSLWHHCVWKPLFSKCFVCTQKRWQFQFPLVWRALIFQKALFCDRLVWMEGITRELTLPCPSGCCQSGSAIEPLWSIDPWTRTNVNLINQLQTSTLFKE